MPKAWWQPCCWTMAWCSHSPFKLSTSHPRPSLWHLEATQPVHSWAGTCVQHAVHQSLKNAMTHWSLRLLYKLEVVYMKSDWYASQACTRYTIAHVNREWCFIKKFTGSQLHFIVQNQIMWVLRCIRNCHTRGELISFPCLRWRWLRLYPCISSLLLATRQSIWATLVTKSRLFRLLSLQPNYPQAFPPDVTSYPHSLASTSTSSSPCSWHHPRHQSPLSQGPHTTYKTKFCTSCSSLHGLFELWDNLLLNVDGAVDISRILFARLFA